MSTIGNPSAVCRCLPLPSARIPARSSALTKMVGDSVEQPDSAAHDWDKDGPTMMKIQKRAPLNLSCGGLGFRV